MAIFAVLLQIACLVNEPDPGYRRLWVITVSGLGLGVSGI